MTENVRYEKRKKNSKQIQKFQVKLNLFHNNDT